MIKIFIVIASATLLISCTRKPEAIIRTDQPAIVGRGSVVNFINRSENAENFEWILPDGTTATTNEVSYTFNKFGLHTVRLIAYSKKDRKSDETSVSFDIQMRQKDFTGTWYGTCNEPITGTYSKTLTLSYEYGSFPPFTTNCTFVK